MHAIFLLAFSSLAIGDDPKGPHYDVLSVMANGLIQVQSQPADNKIFQKVRLLGIDLPKPDPDKPIKARAIQDEAIRVAQCELIEELLKGRKAWIVIDRKAPKTIQGQDIAGQVYRAEDGLWINRELIRAGLAVVGNLSPKPKSAELADLAAAQHEAEAAGLAIWSPAALASMVAEHEQLKASTGAARLKNQIDRLKGKNADRDASLQALAAEAARWRQQILQTNLFAQSEEFARAQREFEEATRRFNASIRDLNDRRSNLSPKEQAQLRDIEETRRRLMYDEEVRLHNYTQAMAMLVKERQEAQARMNMANQAGGPGRVANNNAGNGGREPVNNPTRGNPGGGFPTAGGGNPGSTTVTLPPPSSRQPGFEKPTFSNRATDSNPARSSGPAEKYKDDKPKPGARKP